MKVVYTLLWFQSPNSFDEGRDLIHFLISFSIILFNLFTYFFFLFFFFGCVAQWILVPWQEIKSMPSAVEAWCRNYWASRKFFDSFSISPTEQNVSLLTEILNKWQKINIFLQMLYITNDIFHLSFLKSYFYNWLYLQLKYTHKHTIAHTIKRKAIQTPKWVSLKHISNACIFESVKVN